MQNSRTTAGKTAKTKPAWGAVAIVGLMVAFATIETNVFVALLGAALMGLGAYLGGYMNEGLRDCKTRDCETGTQAGERRAA